MMLAFGMVAALLNVQRDRQRPGDRLAMTDGAAVIHAMQWGFRGMGMWEDTRGVNMLDTAAHFYDTYECADGKFISIGSIEPQFYALLREKLGLNEDAGVRCADGQGQWPALKDKLTAIFKTKKRANGTRSWKGPISVTARSSRWPKRWNIPTMLRAAPSSSSTGRINPPPRRAFWGRPRRPRGAKIILLFSCIVGFHLR